MNKNRLKEVLSIPSVYGEEGLVRDYIQSYAENEGIGFVTPRVHDVKALLVPCAHIEEVLFPPFELALPSNDRRRLQNVLPLCVRRFSPVLRRRCRHQYA